MNISRLLHTLVYLKPKQIIFQLRKFVVKPKYVQMSAPTHKLPSMMTAPIARYEGVNGDIFTFINLSYKFENWNYVGNGTLFTYNLNYFDFINADNVTEEEACRWIDRFINDIPTITWGLDPYPIALRGINWIKFFCCHPECSTKEREDSLYSQYRLLERKLEYHLLGNHLLEDAFSLTIGGYYFGDERMKQKGMKLLQQELQEQILPDGAHYEQSPMYHCILLDRLLDTYNITRAANLVPFAQRMLGHLESICYEDDTWPFFGDAALGIVPTTQDLKDYARRLDISWKALPLKECGYRKMQSERMEAFVDIGNIMATYQPGHSHADALTFELRIDGKPFIVDTGITTYEKNARRQCERGTAAHNTVTVDGRDSSEIWGGFRVGRRAAVVVKKEVIKDVMKEIVASHNGFGGLHERQFLIDGNCFTVSDRCDVGGTEALKTGQWVSHIHLSPSIGKVCLQEGNVIHTDLADIKVTRATKIVLTTCEVATEYNRPQRATKILISFSGQCQYSVFPV